MWINTRSFRLVLWPLVPLSGLPIAAQAQIIPASDGTGSQVQPALQNPQQLDISGGTRAGNNLFHSFQQLNLNAGELANFLSQPDIQNILTRVTGGTPSLINGTLQVTGGPSHLFLLNPSGILFGANAHLNVPGSFTATTATGLGFAQGEWPLDDRPGTLNYSQLAGNPTFFRWATLQPGTLVNAGHLTVDAGQSLNLLAGMVINTGRLTAPGGQILVTAVPGSSLVRLHQPGGLLSLEVQTGLTTSPLSSSASLPQLLTGEGLRSHATGLQVEADGTVRLVGSGMVVPQIAGTTIVSGQLTTSTPTTPTATPQIVVLGHRIALSQAQLEASAVGGGGVILVGGDLQGQGIIPNAQRVFVSHDSHLLANALNAGDGGRIIVWSDQVTRFYGSLTAQGQGTTGQGGLAEVSGALGLDFAGRADLTAPFGASGTLLLDPVNITVIAGSNNPPQLAANDEFADPGINNTINNGTINAALANVVLQASGNITFSAPINMTNAGVGLTAQAFNDITVNSAITTNAGTVNLAGDADNSGAGRVVVNAPIATNGGNIILSGKSNINDQAIVINNNLSSGGGAINLTGENVGVDSEGVVTNFGFTLNSGGGNITITGIGAVDDGIIVQSDIISGGGNVTLSGFSGTGFGIVHAANITSGNGNVTLTANTGPEGIFLQSNINAGSGTLTLSSDRFAVLSSFTSLSGTGDVVWQPVTPSANINLGGNGSFLPSDVLATLNPGFNSAAIGRANGTGSLTLTSDLNFTSPTVLRVPVGNGNINTNGFNITATAGITLQSGNNIVLANNSQISSSGGAVVLNADRDGNSLGAITLNAGARISSNGGDVVLGGGNNPQNTPAFGGAGSSDFGVLLAAGSNINAAGGNVFISGTTNDALIFDAGVLLQGTIQTNGTGNVTITAVSGTGAFNQRGFLSDTTGAGVTVANGNITIVGTARGTSFNNEGIQLRSGTNLTATGSGNIFLTGTGADNNSLSWGILLFDTPAPVIQTNSGNIVMTGIAGSGSLSSPGIGLFNAGITSTGGGNITLMGMGSGASDISADSITIGGANSGNLSLVGNTIDIRGTLSSGGSQTYSGNLILTGDTTLTSGNGSIRVDGLVNGNVAGPNLTVNANSGNVTFNSTIGNSQILGDLTINSGGITTLAAGANTVTLTTDAAGSTQMSGSINTSGNQTYGDTLSLSGSVTFNSSSGNGAIRFNGAVNGNSNVTVNSGDGNVTFNGQVGNTQAPITLTVNSNGTTTFASTVNVSNLVTNAGGTTQLGGSINTSGGQIYGDSVIVTGDVNLNSPAGDGTIRFDNTVNGNGNLTVSTGGGNVTFAATVGDSQAPSSLVVNSNGTTTFTSAVNVGHLTTDAGGTTQINGPVNTTGNQTYGDSVVLNSNTTFNSSGSVNFSGPVNGNTPGLGLTVNALGDTRFTGTLGNSQPFGNLTLNSNGTTQLTNVNAETIVTNAAGITELAGNIVTTGSQTYNDNVVLTGNAALSSGNSSITFVGTVDGSGAGQNLTIASGTGNTTFLAPVGNTTALGNLIINSSGVTILPNIQASSVTTDAAGTTQIAGTVITTGNQTYSDPVTLTAAATLTSNNGNIQLGNTVNGGQNLTVNASNGSAIFSGNLGNTSALNNLDVTANQIDINLATVNTTGSQTYNGLLVNGLSGNLTIRGGFNFTNPVRLVGDTILNFNQPSSIISFSNGLNGPFNITFNAEGRDLTLGGTLGDQTPLESLTVNAGAATIAASVRTTGSQTYTANTTLGASLDSTSGDIIFNEAVLLNNSTSLRAGGGIFFRNTLEGTQTLTMQAGSRIAFEGNVGERSPLGFLTITGANVVGGLPFSPDQLLEQIRTGTRDFPNLRPFGVNGANISASQGLGLGNINSQGDITIQISRGPITLGTVTTSGNAVNLNGVGIGTPEITTQGGALRLNSNNGSVFVGNLNTSAPAAGGDLQIITAGNFVTAGEINTSSANGSGGDVRIDSRLSLVFDTINAQGGRGGQGGTVDLTSFGTVRGLSNFADRLGTNATISTAGGLGGGDITIRYGAQIPFIIGNAVVNGTLAAITSGTDTISPLQPILVPFVQGNIRLIPLNPLPNLRRLDPNLELPDLKDRPDILQLGDIARANVVNNLAFGKIDQALGQIDNLWSGEYSSFAGQNLASTPQTAAGIREILTQVANQTGQRSAIVYMVSQPEGVDLIVIAAGVPTFYQRVTGATRDELLRVAADLRRTVTDVGSEDYLEPAQQLYRWLVKPLEPFLEQQNINNLVLSVDSGLRSLPMAVLHDGQRFLVEKYSLGMIPSISLFDTNLGSLQNVPVLVMGASQFTELNPLPAVITELPIVAQKLGSDQYFLNEQFTIENLRAQRQQRAARIIHLATHGEFRSGDPNESYLQFWDRRLPLTQLRQLNLNNPPADLLVLSACRTALGDQNAEFGFGGLAVQAGVRAAMGSLWYVSDEGTLGFMTEFYHRLRSAPIKADALRQTQLALIQGQVFFSSGQLQTNSGTFPLTGDLAGLERPSLAHPYYWAAFTMIGNPW